jgi:polyhydroxyalkanoate synthesis regulator protein
MKLNQYVHPQYGNHSGEPRIDTWKLIEEKAKHNAKKAADSDTEPNQAPLYVVEKQLSKKEAKFQKQFQTETPYKDVTARCPCCAVLQQDKTARVNQKVKFQTKMENY